MQKQLSLVGLGLGTLAALVGINTTIAVAGSANSTPTETQADTTSTVGGPLAQQLQGKPTVVQIYASWCPGCKNISKTVSALKQLANCWFLWRGFDICSGEFSLR